MKLHVGIVGCGYWGSKLLEKFANLKKECDISCYDLDPSVCKQIKDTRPEIKIAGSYEEMLRDNEIDAIVIATPISSHYVLVKKALENNKNVFVEKPLACSSVQAARLVRMAKSKNKTLMVDHTFVYSPEIREVKKLVRKGFLGNVWIVNMYWLNLGIFQSDVNVIWDLAPHILSILYELFDEEPIKIYCFASGHIKFDIEDDSRITLIYRGCKIVNVHISWLCPAKVRQMVIIGDKKTLVYDDLANNKIIFYDKLKKFDAQRLNIKHEDLLQAIVQDFLKCIQNGSTPKSDGSSALRVIKLIEKIIVSKEVFYDNNI